MDWIEGMQHAVNYMEDNLLGEIDYGRVAREAGCSVFHFQRIFNVLTGFTVGEYVRNRRLTLAGQELALSDVRVTDIAFKYGYETHESFTKAFLKFHGITPSAARVPGAELKSMGRLFIQVILKGDKEMNYRIVEKEAFSVYGTKHHLSSRNGQNFKIIPGFWTESMKDGTFETLLEHGGKLGVMGVCNDFDNDTFDYWIAAEYTGGEIPHGMEKLDVPALRWAVFEAVGPLPEALQDVTKRIFSEWFPASGYEHDDGPEFEIYSPGEGNRPDYKSWVWIPVRRRS